MGTTSKWDEKFVAQARKTVAADGASQVQLADLFLVAPTTFRRWMDKHPELRVAMEEGRELFTRKLEGSLFKRCKGYNYHEDTLEAVKATKAKRDEVQEPDPVDQDGKPEMRLVKRVIKHVPAHIGAIALYLKNTAGWTDAGAIRKTGNTTLMVTVNKTYEDKPKDSIKVAAIDEDGVEVDMEVDLDDADDHVGTGTEPEADDGLGRFTRSPGN